MRLIAFILITGAVIPLTFVMILKMLRAYRLNAEEAGEIFEIVRGASRQMGVRMPELYVLPYAYPDLITMGLGRSYSCLLMTRGLTDLLNREEFTGAVFHEMAKIRSRRLFPATFAALVSAVLTSIPAVLRGVFNAGQFQFSGQHDNAFVWCVNQAARMMCGLLIRVFGKPAQALVFDEVSARESGEPLYLISALKKIESARARLSASLPEFLAHLSAVPGPSYPLSGMKRDILARVQRLEAKFFTFSG